MADIKNSDPDLEIENLEEFEDVDNQFYEVDDLEEDNDIFNAFDGPDDAPLVLDGASTGRGWLVLGLIALLTAVLLRVLLAPVLTQQTMRPERAAQIVNQVALTNASAQSAMTAEGSYQGMQTSLAALQANVDKIVSNDDVSEQVANKLFATQSANSQLSDAWAEYRDSANRFLAKSDGVNTMKRSVLELKNDINTAVVESVAFVDAVAKEGRSKRSDNAKDRYLFLTSEAANINGVLNRLAAGLGNYYLPNTDLKRQSDAQNAQVVRLRDTLTRITGNSAAVVATAAEPLQARFDTLDAKFLELSDRANTATESQAELKQLVANSEQLNSVAGQLGGSSSRVGAIKSLFDILPLILLGLGLFAIWRYASRNNAGAGQGDAGLSDALADQQESILKLLDEMSALADGDLTVEAEVTDQITGAIADSVNFAVIEMRDLVSQINRASLEVASESELAVSSAQSVSLSNRTQAEDIVSAAQEMQRITVGMREMSEQASQSSEMASDSILAATQGAQAVRDTIRGMEDMREQIQDTSKRIKRLGESSQRIGDIVALIDDIAEQTNILSLNAAIQASMAGEAGRGFAVVADEVQGLAERSTEATKKIGELVTTIQNDTNDAVASMEKATQQVVTGTRVADTAGGALAEIENVSANLSNLIQTIATRSNEQAEVVTDVAKKVSMVSSSSTETSRKAQDSADSIAKLLELAKELETSVSRFKLPA